MRHVLIADDEARIREVVQNALEKEGCRVTTVPDGDQALSTALRETTIDLIVLDVSMPGLDGLEVCRRIRAERNTPILFLSAKAEEIDRVLGLEIGGDDYITKPFSPRELVARVKAAVRRASGPATVTDLGRVRIDRDARRVRADGVEVELTATEFDLLAHLAARPGHVFARSELLAQIWGYPGTVDSRTVDVHVAQLRGKLGAASPIRTVRGVGYCADPAGPDGP